MKPSVYGTLGSALGRRARNTLGRQSPLPLRTPSSPTLACDADIVEDPIDAGVSRLR